ncbi:hypothetical protein D3C87_1033220 [compost metagenome]
MPLMKPTPAESLKMPCSSISTPTDTRSTSLPASSRAAGVARNDEEEDAEAAEAIGAAWVFMANP